MNERRPISVMVAGVGGASLGTEICKSLRLAGDYHVFGCDVSGTAYGLYDPLCEATFRINRNNYVSNVIAACQKARAHWLIPGGEQPMILLGVAAADLARAGIRLLGNSPEVISICSNKRKTFELLSDAGIRVPRTVTINSREDVEYVGLPCIVKPSAGSGGSVSVFFAVGANEAMSYAQFIRRSGNTPIAQEYVSDAEGEFTIGVLSLPDGQLAGSVALRRALEAKLSVAYRGRGGVVSSGYSQGFIGDFPSLCSQAEHIAQVVDSRGPINVQGRVRDGVLLPFEINPRFSASTYLRALAGFNEIDVLLRYLNSDDGTLPGRPSLKAGWYLRSLTEHYVTGDQLK